MWFMQYCRSILELINFGVAITMAVVCRYGKVATCRCKMKYSKYNIAFLFPNIVYILEFITEWDRESAETALFTKCFSKSTIEGQTFS